MQDPRYAYPQPPFTPQPQPFPGSSAAMSPEPDHGERTYRGSGQNPDHAGDGGSEIVVADLPVRHPTHHIEGIGVALEEHLLAAFRRAYEHAPSTVMLTCSNASG